MKHWVMLFFFVIVSCLNAGDFLSVQRANRLIYGRASATFWSELERDKGLINNYKELRGLYNQYFAPLDYVVSFESKDSSEDVNMVYQKAFLTAAGIGDSELEFKILTHWRAHPMCDKWLIFLNERGYLKREMVFKDTAFHWVIPGDGKECKKQLTSEFEILRLETFDESKQQAETTLYLNRVTEGRKIPFFKFNHDYGRSVLLLPSQDSTKIAILFFDKMKRGETLTTVTVKGKSYPAMEFTSSNRLDLYIVDCYNPTFQDRSCIVKSWNNTFLNEHILKGFSWENTLKNPEISFEKDDLIQTKEL